MIETCGHKKRNNFSLKNGNPNEDNNSAITHEDNNSAWTRDWKPSTIDHFSLLNSSIICTRKLIKLRKEERHVVGDLPPHRKVLIPPYLAINCGTLLPQPSLKQVIDQNRYSEIAEALNMM